MGGREDLRSRLGLTPMKAFVVAFLFLLGGAVAVGLAQFKAIRVAPWISIVCSGVAVSATVTALLLRPRR